jgi:acetyl-CoA acetyltransferase
VADPLRLLEICATRDGAAAVLLCSKAKARTLTTKPIHLAGVGLGSCMQGDPTVRLGTLSAPVDASAPRLSESVAAAQMAYNMAGISPDDVDLVELPDNSSWHYLQYIETLGLCGPGEADGLLEQGETLIGGKIPICPSGGASSYGEAISAQGLLQVYDVVSQLRGDAGQRQVAGARVGLTQTYGQLGNSSTAILTT